MTYNIYISSIYIRGISSNKIKYKSVFEKSLEVLCMVDSG